MQSTLDNQNKIIARLNALETSPVNSRLDNLENCVNTLLNNLENLRKQQDTLGLTARDIGRKTDWVTQIVVNAPSPLLGAHKVE